MSPPSRAALWRPVEQLGDLDVVVGQPVGSAPRVEIVDRRTWVELLSLSPGEAGALGAVLGEQARRAGWRDTAGG